MRNKYYLINLFSVYEETHELDGMSQVVCHGQNVPGSTYSVSKARIYVCLKIISFTARVKAIRCTMILVSSVGVVTRLEGFTTEGSGYQPQREIHKVVSSVAFISNLGSSYHYTEWVQEASCQG